MKGFTIRTTDDLEIRFRYYTYDAPQTAAAFNDMLPFSATFMHATVSGREIWADEIPGIDTIQENSSVFTKPGEVVIGPQKPTRNKAAGFMGIYYGEGKGLDGCNIFACVYDEDASLLQQLGNRIWKQGAEEIVFNKLG